MGFLPTGNVGERWDEWAAARQPRRLIPDWRRRGVRSRGAAAGAGLCRVLMVFALLACGIAPRAAALNPQRKITQYQSKHWGPEDGLPCTNVLSVAQTANGYLWLGTEEGLVRFDGVRARVYQRQLDRLTGGINLSEVIEDGRHPDWPLFVSSTGSIGRLADGELQVIAQDLASTHQPGRTLLQDPADGTLWVGTVHGLYHIGLNGEVAGPDAASPEWPAEPINTLCRDRAGRLWVGGAQGIYRQRKRAVSASNPWRIGRAKRWIASCRPGAGGCGSARAATGSAGWGKTMPFTRAISSPAAS